MVDLQERPSPSTPRSRFRWEWLVVPMVAALGVYAAVVMFSPHVYAGTVLQFPQEVPSMDGMVFHTGEPAGLDRFAGDVALVYFGYTNCPDICPTTLFNAARAREMMGSAGDRLQVIMVSVDPQRDTADALGTYVGHFDDTFLGVTGNPDDLSRVATLFGIHVKQNEGSVEEGYTVDHTGSLMAIDPEGSIRVLYPHDVDPEALADDLVELLG